jgi:acetyl esterase/lipase
MKFPLPGDRRNAPHGYIFASVETRLPDGRASTWSVYWHTMRALIYPGVILLAVTLSFPANAAELSARDENDTGQPGTMSKEELRKEPIMFELDVPYADTGNPRHRLDLYLPKNTTSSPLPVIVFFHGGGWMQGDKSDGAGRLMPFVRTGQYAGVSVGYRLSGESKWPAQIHDSKAAIRWIRANASKYGLDPDHIGVWGRSAGAHLALMLGVSGDAPELEGAIGAHHDVSSRVQAVANFFGVSEMLSIIGQPTDIDRTLPNAPEAALIGGALRENAGKAKAASPISHVSPNDPPVLTVHGSDDRTVPYDQAVRLDAALRKAAVPSFLIRVEGAGHGNFGTSADGRVLAFFNKYLRGQNVEVPTTEIQDWRR